MASYVGPTWASGDYLKAADLNSVARVVESISGDVEAIKNSGNGDSGDGRKIRGLRTSYVELAKLLSPSSAPVGPKPVVVADIEGTGYISRIWHAMSANAAALRGVRVVVYADDMTTPVVNSSVESFFCYSGYSSAYSNGVTGKASNYDEQSGGFRYTKIPFRSWARVEFVNDSASDIQSFYGIIDYALTETAEGSYRYVSNTESVSPYDAISVAVQGAGSVESVSIIAEAPGENVWSWMEGNPEIVSAESLVTSPGMEDFFDGAWYKVIDSGYPSGQVETLSDATVSRKVLYRNFVGTQPVFSGGVSFNVPMGQRGQGLLMSDPIAVTVGIGAMLDDANPVHHVTAGEIIGLPEPSHNSELPAVSVNGGTAVFDENSGADNRVAYNIGVSDDYVVSATVTLDGDHDGATAGIVFLGAEDPFYGSGCHVQVIRDNANQARVVARDDWDLTVTAVIDSGETAGKSYDIAASVSGGVVTVFWKHHGTDSYQSVGSWTATKSGTTVGAMTWETAATVADLTVKNLLVLS